MGAAKTKKLPDSRMVVELDQTEVIGIIGEKYGLPESTMVNWRLHSTPGEKSFTIQLFWERMDS